MYDVNKDWVDRFEISDPDGTLAAEFRRTPVGHHSPTLQRVLLKLVGAEHESAYVLICRVPHRQWVLARMPNNPRAPLTILEDCVFDSLEAAEREVFKRRWKAGTGQDIT